MRRRVLDQAKNAARKQASRDEDARRLAAGEVTREELCRENNFFRDLRDTEIIAIGGKPIRRTQ